MEQTHADDCTGCGMFRSPFLSFSGNTGVDVGFIVASSCPYKKREGVSKTAGCAAPEPSLVASWCLCPIMRSVQAKQTRARF